MIFIWNIFLSQSTFNTKNHLFLSTRKVAKRFHLLNCTSACNFNSFETKTRSFPYAIRSLLLSRNIFFTSYVLFLPTFFFLFNKLLRHVSISLFYPFRNHNRQIINLNIWNIFLMKILQNKNRNDKIKISNSDYNKWITAKDNISIIINCIKKSCKKIQCSIINPIIHFEI